MSRTKWEEYLICKERGHQADNKLLLSYPPKSQCKWCGTTFRHEPRLIEGNVPNPPTSRERGET